MLFFISS